MYYGKLPIRQYAVYGNLPYVIIGVAMPKRMSGHEERLLRQLRCIGDRSHGDRRPMDVCLLDLHV